ncbi:MAG: 3-dehydroquinate synthase [Desulfobaccales bacterium]
MREILIPSAGRDDSSRLLLGTGLRRRLGRLLKPLGFPPRLFVITDRRVGRLYGPEIQTALAERNFQANLLEFPPGERSKCWAVVQRLARELLAWGAHRGTPLIALGGGVAGDITGFLASIYMRGVPLVQVPTSLLAMVDASIGGKTAINLPEGKNLLGTFHQPRLVVIDPEFLATLPSPERLNGLAEVLKAGFIRDRELLERLDREGPGIFRRPQELLEVIHRAAAIKAAIVAADFREAGLRRLLNFGHTLGHGLEAASRFRLPHGLAVAWGMLMALGLSERLTGLPEEEAEWGRRLLLDFGYGKKLPRLDPEAVLAALGRDKKRQERGLVFVLLKHLGEAVIEEDVPMALAADAVAGLLRRRQGA